MIIGPFRYGWRGGYDAARYWRDRFVRHGAASLRSVGHESLSESENAAMYDNARDELLSACRREGINLAEARVLDIGCGNGFFTRVFSSAGVASYTGVDITDVFFPELRKRHPQFTFVKGDVTAGLPEGSFDVIVMIDVIEHIVSRERLNAAMNHVRAALSPGGVFFVSPIMARARRHLFYVHFWSREDVMRSFRSDEFVEQFPFRSSSMMCIRRK